MTARRAPAAGLVLSVGLILSAAAHADVFMKFEGVAGESTRLHVTDFPSNTFSPRQLQALERAGIETAADLIAADPALVGRIMGVSVRDARITQQRLSQVMRASR